VDPTEAILNEGNISSGTFRDVIKTLPARPRVLPSLFGYVFVNYFLVAVCITLAIPAGIFVPSFVIGACGGRIVGECMYMLFPNGIRGPDGPQIYPGLYAVVGAAAYTGAVTHSLSIAVIVCETTGQLSPLLPVLVSGGFLNFQRFKFFEVFKISKFKTTP
jgi:H+/Cl- antiporter ClcA